MESMSYLGGGRGIRTPVRVAPQTVFKTAGFNRSPIPPSSIIPESFYLRRLSLLESPGLGLDCHHSVTAGDLLHCRLLGLVVGVGIAHGDGDARMAQKLLCRHDVNAFPNEPGSERVPENMPGYARQARFFARDLQTGLQVAEAVPRHVVVDHVGTFLHRLPCHQNRSEERR